MGKSDQEIEAERVVSIEKRAKARVAAWRPSAPIGLGWDDLDRLDNGLRRVIVSLANRIAGAGGFIERATGSAVSSGSMTVGLRPGGPVGFDVLAAYAQEEATAGGVGSIPHPDLGVVILVAAQTASPRAKPIPAKAETGAEG